MRKLFFTLLTLTTLLFFPYLSGDKLFIFRDIGQDFFESGWPSYLHMSRMIGRLEFPVYSFDIGLGTNVFFGNLRRTSIADPFVWFTLVSIFYFEQNFIFVVPWIVIFKIILAGLLFYQFLKRMSISEHSAFLVSLGYSFSGQMLVRSGWYHYTTEMVYIPILLLAVLRFYSNRTARYLVFCFLWIAAYHSYYALVYFIFGLLFYIYLIIQKQSSIQEFIRKIAHFSFISFLGVLISSAIFLPSMFNILSSARVNTALISEKKDDLLVNSELFKVTLTRFFGNDLLGVSNQYSGYRNTLEDPILYTGLLILILVSLSWVLSNSSEQTALIGVFLTTTLYLLVPNFTRIINGFYGTNFKTSAFFISVFFLLISAKTLDKIIYMDLSYILKRKIFFLSIIPLVIFTILYFYIKFFSETLSIDNKQAILSFVFLFFYTVVINLLLLKKNKSFPYILLSILFALEILVLGKFTLINRLTLSHDEYRNLLTESASVKSVTKSLENATEFYRIEKNFGVFGDNGVNDAVALGYMGIRTYNSFNHRSFARFMESFQVMDGNFEFRYFAGFGELHTPLNKLLGVRYYLEKNSDGTLEVVEDESAIKFGTIFYGSITEKDFEQLDFDTKNKVMVSKIVVKDPNDFIVNDSNDQCYSDYLKISNKNNTKIEGEINAPCDGLLFFPILYDQGWRLYINGERMTISEAYYGLSYSKIEKGNHTVVLRYKQPLQKIGLFLSAFTLIILGLYQFYIYYYKIHRI